MRIVDHPSPNHGPRPAGQGVDMLVLHYTGMPTAADALARMCDPATQVSAHYVVDEDGTVLALVPEERRAWHAGRGWWRGRSDINSCSIGVEIVNPGHEFGYRPFPEAQMAAVVALCRDILSRHPAIAPVGVVAHADIAPWRKEDPGELFDWPRLAAAGIGIMPSADDLAAVSPADLRAATLCPGRLLTAIGYQVAVPGSLWTALVAFQRRYRPHILNGRADEDSLRRLVALHRRLV